MGKTIVGREFQTTQASADFVRAHYANVAAVVIGRRLFDLTNGWNGQPAAGEHGFVVTHEPPKIGARHGVPTLVPPIRANQAPSSP